MDKAKPTITVITIVKDIVKSGRKDLLRECIESVSGQTYQNIQHILMDGKSSDGTLELLEELKGIFGDRLEIHSQKDQSIDEAYNNALRYAKGKYVFFMNSDDKYYSSQALEHCFEAMEREQADYCFGQESRYDRNDNFVSTWIPDINIFWFTMPFSHQAMGVRRDVLESLGNYDTSCGIGGDYDLIVKLIWGDYKGVEIPEIISYYRLGGISSATDDVYANLKTLHAMTMRTYKYSKVFYPELTVDQCEHIFRTYTSPGATNVFPKFFLNRLIRFIIERNLKNIDNKKLVERILAMYPLQQTDTVQPVTVSSAAHVQSQPLTYLYFCLFGIPVIKVLWKQLTVKSYLFGFLPFVKFYYKR